MLTKEEAFALPRVFIYTLLLVLLAAVATGMWLGFRPYFLDQEREANTHSQQFVAARQAAIATDVEQCAQINADIATLQEEPGHENRIAALEVQRGALAARVRRALNEIPESTRPDNISACH